MARECATEDLEALVNGTLDGEAAARVAAHAGECAACSDELAWLRAEAELMARRKRAQTAPAPALWEGIAARIAEPQIVTAEPSAPSTTPPSSSSSSLSLAATAPRRWHWGARVAYGGLLAAAAAALLFVAWPHGPATQAAKIAESLHDAAVGPSLAHARKKLAPEVTLANAEQEYKDALSVLEAQYKAERGRLPPTVAKRYDSLLSQTRTRVADARASAGNDVDGRMVVLDGYAEYLRSLQRIVSDIR